MKPLQLNTSKLEAAKERALAVLKNIARLTGTPRASAVYFDSGRGSYYAIFEDPSVVSYEVLGSTYGLKVVGTADRYGNLL